MDRCWRVQPGLAGQGHAAGPRCRGQAAACWRYAGNSEAVARFAAEARHGGSLNHEHTARVYDYGEPGPQAPPYLVLELVDGQSLADRLAPGPLNVPQALDVIAQVADGLAAAHAAGVIHRGIKPANLLLSDTGLAKITDFGISHAIGSAPITGTGMIIGTAAYLAPERTAGAQASAAGDVYALGMVGYECLVGTPPFSGTGIEQAIAHREQPLPPLPALVPADVAAFIAQLAAKDPDRRPGGTPRWPGGPGSCEMSTRALTLRRSKWYPARPAITRRESGLPASLAPASCLHHRPPQGHRQHGRRQHGRRQHGRRRQGRRQHGCHPRAAAAITAACVALALAGLILASVSALEPGQRPAGRRRLRHGSRPATAPAIRLGWRSMSTAQLLVGEPVSHAVRDLRRQGLAVRVQWQRTSHQPTRPGCATSSRRDGCSAAAWSPSSAPASRKIHRARPPDMATATTRATATSQGHAKCSPSCCRCQPGVSPVGRGCLCQPRRAVGGRQIQACCGDPPDADRQARPSPARPGASSAAASRE